MLGKLACTTRVVAVRHSAKPKAAKRTYFFNAPGDRQEVACKNYGVETWSHQPLREDLEGNYFAEPAPISKMVKSMRHARINPMMGQFGMKHEDVLLELPETCEAMARVPEEELFKRARRMKRAAVLYTTGRRLDVADQPTEAEQKSTYCMPYLRQTAFEHRYREMFRFSQFGGKFIDLITCRLKPGLPTATFLTKKRPPPPTGAERIELQKQAKFVKDCDELRADKVLQSEIETEVEFAKESARALAKAEENPRLVASRARMEKLAKRIEQKL